MVSNLTLKLTETLVEESEIYPVPSQAISLSKDHFLIYLRTSSVLKQIITEITKNNGKRVPRQLPELLSSLSQKH